MKTKYRVSSYEGTAMKLFIIFSCILFFGLYFSSAFAGTAPITAGRFEVVADQVVAKLPYSSNHPIDIENTSITRLIVSIHSSDPIAQTYFQSALDATLTAKNTDNTTLIIAPQFFEDDQFQEPIPADLLYWDVRPYWGSSRGLVGPNRQLMSISSFHVIDSLLTEITTSGLFPNLRTIVILGHSAGGQMVNRYAASSLFETETAQPLCIKVKYLVMAPSSFIYLNNKRIVAGADNQFSIPSSAQLSSCSTYNAYGYGLEYLYSYQTSVGANSNIIQSQYSKRNVLYLVGSEDNDPNDSSLSVTCSSMLQGQNRLDRARIYFNHLIDQYGSQVADTHQFKIAQGVGHWGRGLMLSEHGLAFLFTDKPGDINNDNTIDLKDSIVGLQVQTNHALDSSCLTTNSDVNNDDSIGLAEVIFTLKSLSAEMNTN